MKKGFYKWDPITKKFVLLAQSEPNTWVQTETFEDIEKKTNILYILSSDCTVGEKQYKKGFYTYDEDLDDFVLQSGSSEVFTDIDVDSNLPTTDINDMTIYRKTYYVYKHNSIKLDSAPNGYKILDTENIIISSTGITIDDTETLWSDLNSTIINDLIENNRLEGTDFDDADFFNYDSTLFDISTNFTREIDYKNYHNPTKTVGGYISISDFVPDNTQLEAINSGINATKLNKIETDIDNLQENLANFIGNFPTKADLLAYIGALTNNDYAVVSNDETHSNECWRYIYNADTHSWLAQYKVNETPINTTDQSSNPTDTDSLSDLNGTTNKRWTFAKIWNWFINKLSNNCEKGIQVSSGKIGHSNSPITPQSALAIYPIKMDQYGHIIEVGIGQSLTTEYKSGANNQIFTRNGANNMWKQTTKMVGIFKRTSSINVTTDTMNNITLQSVNDNDTTYCKLASNGCKILKAGIYRIDITMRLQDSVSNANLKHWNISVTNSNDGNEGGGWESTFYRHKQSEPFFVYYPANTIIYPMVYPVKTGAITGNTDLLNYVTMNVSCVKES